jgi:hypothetical protein
MWQNILNLNRCSPGFWRIDERSDPWSPNRFHFSILSLQERLKVGSPLPVKTKINLKFTFQGFNYLKLRFQFIEKCYDMPFYIMLKCSKGCYENKLRFKTNKVFSCNKTSLFWLRFWDSSHMRVREINSFPTSNLELALKVRHYDLEPCVYEYL